MATLIGERRRGTLPPVATLKYHDPAMCPVCDPVSRKNREKFRLYFGGCSSLLSQANTLSVFRGSG
jgi:hypothetical protein